jgi:maltose O-acetyltransferase
MGIQFYLLSLPGRMLRLLEVICLRKMLGQLGQGSPLNRWVITSFPNQVVIGDDVSIAPGAHLGASNQGSITIGDRCAIAEGTRIVTATHHPHSLPVARVGNNKSVVIGADVRIGTGANVLPGGTIQDGAMVAPDVVVVEDVPPDCMVGGVPARLIRRLEPREKRLEGGKFPRGFCVAIEPDIIAVLEME